MIITLLRKPLEGSVADNALKHGCGAINIDDTRIKGESTVTKHYARSHFGRNSKEQESYVTGSELGRWPANFILIHLEGCELKGTKKIKGGTVGKNSEINESKTGISMNNSTGGIHRVSHVDEEGKEEVEDWACVEGCPVKELDQQSGHLKSGEMKADSYKQWGKHGIYGEGKEHPATYYGDEGGASRFFKQFKGS